MLRHFLFKAYGWLALTFGVAGISIAIVFYKGDALSLLSPIIASALGFCYFVQQQRLAETMLFKQLFTEFNLRYDGLNDKLTEIATQRTLPSPQDRQVVVDYFNLCAEEYLFFRRGYITPEVWRSWCRGMRVYILQEPFRGLWDEEEKSDAFYGLSFKEIESGAQISN
jgi:hypothetical protein